MRRVLITLLPVLAGAALQPFVVDRESGAVLMLLTVALSAIVAITSQPVRSRVRPYRLRSPLVRADRQPPVPVPALASVLLPKWAAPGALLPRVFVADNVTPRYLLSLGEGMLSAQREALRAPFVDKWMRVQGVVEDVDLHAGDVTMIYATVTTTDTLDSRVSLAFEPAWKERVLSFIQGSPVKAVGRIRGVSDVFNSVDLKDCELE